MLKSEPVSPEVEVHETPMTPETPDTPLSPLTPEPTLSEEIFQKKFDFDSKTVKNY